MKYLLAILVVLHGLVHIIGFASAFGYYHSVRFSKHISKPSGLLWLLAGLLFVAAGILIVAGHGWWYTGVPAIVLSQLLIFSVWKDARAGSFSNLVICIAVMINYSGWHFYRVADRQAATLLNVAPGNAIVTKEMLSFLPSVVQKWLVHSGVVGKEKAYTVRLKQVGKLRTTPDGKWMNVEAVQYFTIDKPSFIWIARINANPFMYIAGKDSYEEGHGGMQIRMLPAIKVANASGSFLDQGTLVRFLAEIEWFPSAALCPYISWTAIDSFSALATMKYGGITASGIFTFNMAGDIVSFQAQRYMEHKGTYSIESWFVPVTEYSQFNGCRVPSKGVATWKLKEGDFTWFHWEITDVAYNVRETYRVAWYNL